MIFHLLLDEKALSKWDPLLKERIESYSYRISSIIRPEIFSFQNNHKNLDPSYKMDLDL